ncbi:MAG: hypothetical protein Q9160_001965 [Pyrenula sp. 1 TL-2023]
MRSSKRRVIFPKSTRAFLSQSNNPSLKQKDSKLMEIESTIPPLSSLKDMEQSFPFSASASSSSPFKIPSHFTKPSRFRDSLRTQTSKVQDEVVAAALPLLTAALNPSSDPFESNPHGVPRLNREEHVEFLQGGLEEFPAQMVGLDASRPWMVYWSMTGLWLLGEDMSTYEESALKTLTIFSHPSGGFSSSPGHSPHLASTYPAILTLALMASLPSTSPTTRSKLYTLTNRRQLWRLLSRLKQPSGGFRVSEGGEEDVRGAYIAMVCIALLDLPLNLAEDCDARRKHGMRYLTDGLGEWVGRCQSRWEGGIAEKPAREAHGAYAFCGLACLCLIGSDPRESVQRYLNVDGLTRWLAMRQNAPEGGFSGRTGKLVDGCYTLWVGGCWPLLLGVLNGPVHNSERIDKTKEEEDDDTAAQTILQKEGWMVSREGIARWVLSCCQQPGGGLRDKPGKPGDSYHTLYTLAGLSATQHQHYYLTPTTLHEKFTPGMAWRSQPLNPVFAAETEPYDVWGEDEERLRPLHPIFCCPREAAEGIRRWSEEQGRGWGVLEGGGIV